MESNVNNYVICIKCKHCVTQILECNYCKANVAYMNFVTGEVVYKTCLRCNMNGQCKKFEKKETIFEKIKKLFKL